MTFIKPLKLAESTVLTAPVAADIDLDKGKISFPGTIQNSFRLEDVVGYKETDYAAGTLQVTEIDFSGVSAANDTAYQVKIRPNTQVGEQREEITINFFTPSTGTTTTTLKEKFVEAVNNNPERIVDGASVSATVASITERDLDTGGFLVIEVPTGATTSTTAAHVDDSGTLAEVQVYDSTVGAGQYKKYEFEVKVDSEAPLNADKGHNNLIYIVWANESGGSFAAWDAKVQQILTASNVADANARPYLAVK